jgi:hypothetical protein
MKILVIWEAPVARPDDDNIYTWNEENQSWTLENLVSTSNF